MYVTVTILNAQRKSQGLPLVGLLNPTLYSNQSTGLFNDITIGNNKCRRNPVAANAQCCTSGFTTAVGWLVLQ